MKATKKLKLYYYVQAKGGSLVAGPFKRKVDAQTAQSSYKRRTGKQAFVVAQGQ